MCTDRADLRGHLRGLRRALSGDEQRRAASAVTEALSAWLDSLGPATAAVYEATDGEPDVSGVVGQLRQNHWQVCYPRIDADPSGTATMGFYVVGSETELVPGQFGLSEPNSTSVEVHAADLEFVLVPLVGFDAELNRLGRGKGFYDRAFNFLGHSQRPAKPLLVGVAHETQRVERLANTALDVRLDAVVTPEVIYGAL